MRRRVTWPRRWSRAVPSPPAGQGSSAEVASTASDGTAQAMAVGASPGDRAAVVLGTILLGLFAWSQQELPGESAHPFDLWAGALLVAAGACLLLGRRFPATAAALQLGLSVVWYSRYAIRLIDIPAAVTFYVLGTTGDRRRQLGVGGVAIALLLTSVLDDPSSSDVVVEGVGWTVAAILCGELVRSRRLLLDQYAERADRAEAERDAEAERRVAQERMRIARDVHDVLAHTVSLMSVQAEVAADAVERSADRSTVRSALATLRSTGKEAMAEVRATVSVLRGAAGRSGAAAGDPVDTAPAPNLDRVTELVDAGRAQGLDVELTVDLKGVDVESLVELTAYRIVQESLTNVVRHAAASRAAVRIHGAPSGLVVEVVDDGRVTAHPSPGGPGWPEPAVAPRSARPPAAVTSPAGRASPTMPTGGRPAADTPAAPRATSTGSGSAGAGPPKAASAATAVRDRHTSTAGGAGFGLRGMSERVEAVGGELSYGPMPGRGWAVRATLPTKRSPTALSDAAGTATEGGEKP